MDVIRIDESRKKEWEDYLMENPYAIAWQSFDWSDVVRRNYEAEFIPLAAYDGRIRGVLPLYRMEGFLIKNQLISVPYAVAGGIVSDNDEASASLIESAVAMYRKSEGMSGITLKQYKVKAPGDLRVDENFYNAELGLSPDIDEMWSRISQTNQEKIEETRAFSLVLDYPSDSIDEFYKLLLIHHRNNGVPCVAKKWIQDLVSFKMYSIALLRLSGEIVAGTMVKKYKRTVSFPFTSLTSLDARTNLFAYNLYWQLIKNFIQEGFEIFHSGRIPKTDETNEYRLGWGGARYPYYYQYYPGGTGATEFSKKRGKKRQVVSSVFKRMPLGVSRIIGPLIASRFP